MNTESFSDRGRSVKSDLKPQAQYRNQDSCAGYRNDVGRCLFGVSTFLACSLQVIATSVDPLPPPIPSAYTTFLALEKERNANWESLPSGEQRKKLCHLTTCIWEDCAKFMQQPFIAYGFFAPIVILVQGHCVHAIFIPYVHEICNLHLMRTKKF